MASLRGFARVAVARAMRELRVDRRVSAVVILFAVCQLLVATWDIPSSFSWENDGIAPRDLFGGLKFNLTPGEAHRYPLMQYLILAIGSLPWLLLAAARARHFSLEELQSEVLAVDVMTGVSATAKILSVAAACVSVWVLVKLARQAVGRNAGFWTAICAVTSLSFSYYGRTSNLDAPALMWITLALYQTSRCARTGAAQDYRWLGFFAAASIATKDQAYAAFTLTGPVYWLLWPLLRPQDWAAGAQHFRRLGATLLTFIAAYAALGGALWNPTGFLAHLRLLAGTNSQDWRTYRGLDGAAQNFADVIADQANTFWPWPLVLVAWLGVALAFRLPKDRRWLATLPLAAGASSLLSFTLVVGRTGHRFTLVLGFFLSMYAGFAIAQFLAYARGARWAQGLAALLCIHAAWPCVLLALTQWGDARLQVEALLRTLPPGSTVETYGLLVYLPRFETAPGTPYTVQHVGKHRFPPLPGVSQAIDNYGNIRRRNPDCLVIPEGYASRYIVAPQGGRSVQTEHSLSDEDAVAFFRAAVNDQLPNYRAVLTAEASLPGWSRALGGRPVRVHGSTAQRQWVLCRTGVTPLGGRNGRPSRPKEFAAK